MTETPAQSPPALVTGVNPQNAAEINMTLGVHLRGFVDLRETIAHDQGFLAGTDLTAAPYSMSADDQTLLKSAISDLNMALQGIDMTFINRLTGLW